MGKDKFDKLGFVELEQTLFCDRYLELAETSEYVQIQGNYIGQNHNKFLAYSRRGEHCSPVKKCDTYGIIALFTNYNFKIFK